MTGPGALPLAAVATSVVYNRWWTALVIAAVVLLVVVVLLELIRRTVKRIQACVSDIWTGGTHIAANTVTIAQLERTNLHAGMLLEQAGGIVANAERIRAATTTERGQT